MANYFEGKSLESRVRYPDDWKPVPHYTDKFGKPLKYERKYGKPTNTGHFLYITAKHNRGDIERIASKNKKLAQIESERQRQEARKRELAAIKERREKEMKKHGFGEEDYRIAGQLWRAENAIYGTEYLLYKNDLASKIPGFNKLSEKKQKSLVKDHMEADKDNNVPRSYYDQMGRAMRPLGQPDLTKDDIRFGEDHGWFNVPQRQRDVHLRLMQDRDANDDWMPMRDPAPVLTEVYRGQMGLPYNFGSYDQRWEAYQNWKEQQRLEEIEKQNNRGAFNQYMGSINPMV
tara:strand:- start:223 stop:1089 length:867 start_codon:yes stop_codon:yes gene_type:complete